MDIWRFYKSIMGWMYILCSIVTGNIDQYKFDPSAFIFSLKNPFNSLPTKLKSFGSFYSLRCHPSCGPIFANFDYDLYISDHCNENDDCYIGNGSDHCGFESDYQNKRSFFVNTNTPDKTNYFSVSDYEVFSLDTDTDLLPYGIHYHDFILNYQNDNNMDFSLLPKDANENDVYADLNLISILEPTKDVLKISKHFFVTPSDIFPNTTIIEKQYDSYFKEWIGDFQWKLVYRASDNQYTAKSFHEKCDNLNSPSVVVIKSTGGWIFGGFLTTSWDTIKLESIL